MPLRVGGEDVEANWRGGGGEGVADIWVSCMTIYRIGRGEQTREKVIVQELLSPRSSDRPIKKPLLWPRQATLDGRGCRRAQFWNYATQEPSRPSSFYPWWEDILHCRTRIVSLGMGWIHSIMISSVRCNEKQTISNENHGVEIAPLSGLNLFAGKRSPTGVLDRLDAKEVHLRTRTFDSSIERGERERDRIWLKVSLWPHLLIQCFR